MIPDGCPGCFRLVGVVCPVHCLGECPDSEHFDLCAGPTRNRTLEFWHRRGVQITPAFAEAVLAIERAARDAFDHAIRTR